MSWLVPQLNLPGSLLFSYLGVPLNQIPKLFCDNLSALYVTVNPVYHVQTKHIELDYHFVREKVTNDSLITCFVPSHKQLADTFTKHLPKTHFIELRNKLRVQAMQHSSLKKDIRDQASQNQIDTKYELIKLPQNPDN